jgi:hypothetical protein
MIEGNGSVPRYNGTGTGMPKNIQILRIQIQLRIRNTSTLLFPLLCLAMILPSSINQLFLYFWKVCQRWALLAAYWPILGQFRPGDIMVSLPPRCPPFTPRQLEAIPLCFPLPTRGTTQVVGISWLILLAPRWASNAVVRSFPLIPVE